MSILKVAQLGNPILRRNSSDVPLPMIQTPDFQKFIDDMIDTMHEYDGVGLAAPQVHVNLRVFTMEVLSNPRYPNRADYPLTIVINPVITIINSDSVGDWEGCLSIPGLRGFVPRTFSLNLKGLDRQGKAIDLSLEGFPARIAQHETDHCNGKIYLDRMPSFTKLAFQREYERFHLDKLPNPEK